LFNRSLTIGDYLSNGQYCRLVMLIEPYHPPSHEKYNARVGRSHFVVCYLCHQICCKRLMT